MTKAETISAIKLALAAQPTAADLVRWRQDDRIGVQKLLDRYEKQQQKQAEKLAAFQARLSFERDAWSEGLVLAGVDEVGRGPLAGPVVAAAVVIDDQFDLLAVHDSKQLSEKARLALDAAIKEEVVAFAFGVVDAAAIDTLNIYEASRVAMKQAIENLSVQVDG